MTIITKTNRTNFSWLGAALFPLASLAACQWGVLDVGTPQEDAEDAGDGFEGDVVRDRVDGQDIPDTEPERACTSDNQCRDDEQCSGDETCGDDGFCVAGVNLDDGTACANASGDIGICRGGACVAAGCGNGRIDGTEECDDGNMVPDDGCENDCTYSCHSDLECGDSNACNGLEVCNTGTHVCGSGTPPADGFVCLAEPRSICLGGTCSESTCGDGFVDEGGGEFCEPPGTGNCRPDCTLGCAGPADCPDDGNVCNGDEYCDTVSMTCQRSSPPGEGTECQASPRLICIGGNCQASTCGDSFTDAVTGEECDDGNTVEGDGCDNNCAFSCEVATQASDCNDSLPCTDDLCDGGTHTCSHPTSGTSTLCRPVAGRCDVEEYCNGTDTTCPADGFLASTVECRAAAGSCDVAENCTGSSAACPADAFQPSGTTCNDGLYCTSTDQCNGSGSCIGSGDPCQVWQLCSETGGGRCDAGLVINEFKTGTSGSYYDEYIEIYNKKSVALDISSYSLYFRDNTGGGLATLVTFPAGATIAAGGYTSVGRGAYAPPVTDYTDLANIYNSGGGIGFYAGAETAANRIDSVAYGTSAGTHPYSEGGTVAPTSTNCSVSRCPNGNDTNSNSADFQVTATCTLELTNACP
jgi:cysteine-rich repeat protein